MDVGAIGCSSGGDSFALELGTLPEERTTSALLVEEAHHLLLKVILHSLPLLYCTWGRTGSQSIPAAGVHRENEVCGIATSYSFWEQLWGWGGGVSSSGGSAGLRWRSSSSYKNVKRIWPAESPTKHILYTVKVNLSSLPLLTGKFSNWLTSLHFCDVI